MKHFLTLAFLTLSLMADVTIGTSLTNITLDNDDGGYVKGGAYDALMLKGKTTLLMYVDPDEKSKGEVFKPTIEAFEKELDFSKFQIVVILNLNATWKPNALIESLLENKMKEYPKRTYVIDKNSVLVKKWNLVDDEYNVLVLNPDAEVLYVHKGEWDKSEMSVANDVVRNSVK